MLNTKDAPPKTENWSKKAGWLVSLKAVVLDRTLLILLAFSFVLLVAWSFAIPIFESPDENLHWQYARHLNQTLALPVYEPGFGEANSPPLYYILIAPFASGGDVPALYSGQNGPTQTSDGIIHPTGTQVFQHTNADFGRYWNIRLARLFTVLISLLTITFTYLAAKEVTNNVNTSLLAGGLVAFLPMFTFRAASISNDALVTALCAASVYLFLRILKRGFTWKITIITAVVISLAFLSKASAIFLPFPFLLVLLWQKANWRTHLVRFSILGVVGLAIVGPWALRNVVLYGDPLASKIMLQAVPTIIEIKPITDPYFVTQFPVLLSLSFVGVLGWMNVFLPNWIYALFGILALVAVSGYFWLILHHKVDKRVILVLLTFPILALLVVININLTFTQAQGRYLFPALPAIALLVVFGLENIPFWSHRLSKTIVGGLILINVFILIFLYIPTYWPASV